ncbi:MAG TPA: TCR/Tet family MFS transporter [Xanthobacteraceae bacterium]|nr:TCR/Tet family MFS transporter [Xanthobacteraceae bacterium]
MTDTTIATPRRAAFIFVFITVLLDMLALGLIIPVMPQLVLQFVGGDHVKATDVYGIFATVWALMQFLFSPIQGAMSDRYGRRPVILVSNFTLGLDYILMAVAPSLALLFLGRVLSGMAAASISTSYAYIADVTPAEQRAAKFGMLGVAFGVGFIIGPALGGLLGSFDLRLPFWVAAGLSLLNGCYGFLVLPESLPQDRRAPFSWRRANPIGSLKLLRSHSELFGLSAVSLFNGLAHAALSTVTVLYLTFRYNWNEWMIGVTMAIIGVCSLVVQGFGIRIVVARFGERIALYVGLLFGIAGFIVFAFAPTGYWFWAGIPLLAFWGLSGAATLALMTHRVSPTEQGQLQGANASLMGIASMVGPLVFTLSYSYAINPANHFNFSGTPFILAALILLVALVVSVQVTRAPAH